MKEEKRRKKRMSRRDEGLDGKERKRKAKRR